MSAGHWVAGGWETLPSGTLRGPEIAARTVLAQKDAALRLWTLDFGLWTLGFGTILQYFTPRFLRLVFLCTLALVHLHRQYCVSASCCDATADI